MCPQLGSSATCSCGVTSLKRGVVQGSLLSTCNIPLPLKRVRGASEAPLIAKMSFQDIGEIEKSAGSDDVSDTQTKANEAQLATDVIDIVPICRTGSISRFLNHALPLIWH